VVAPGRKPLPARCIVFHPSFFPNGLHCIFPDGLEYGDSFYVKRRDKIGEPWLWKSVIATIPPHLLLLCGITWLILASPGFARSAISSLTLVVVCFGCESVIFDWIADRFKARGT